MQSFMAIGRLVRKPELQTTASGIVMTRFTLAVQRNKEKVDFLNCVAWKGRAEIITKYCDKGSQIAIDGAVQTDEFEKDGQKKYKTEIVVNSIKLLSGNKKEETTKDDLPF